MEMLLLKGSLIASRVVVCVCGDRFPVRRWGGDQQNALLIDSIQPINLYLFYSDEEKKERTAKLLMKWGKKRERMIGANMSSSTHTQYSAFVTVAHDDLLLFILFFIEENPSFQE